MKRIQLTDYQQKWAARLITICATLSTLATGSASGTSTLTLTFQREVPAAGSAEVVSIGASSDTKELKITVQPTMIVSASFPIPADAEINFDDGASIESEFLPCKGCAPIKSTVRRNDNRLDVEGLGGAYFVCIVDCSRFTVMLRQEQGNQPLRVTANIEALVEEADSIERPDYAELWIEE